MKQGYTEYLRTKFKNKLIKKFLMFVMICMLCFSVIYNYNIFNLGMRIYNYENNVKAYEKIKNEQGISKLCNINSDFIAWIKCEDVSISLPVVKAESKTKEDFYMTHDFEFYQNPLGTPYQKMGCNINNTSNTVIVGHSAFVQTWLNKESTHSVFGGLKNYFTTSGNYNYNISVQTLDSSLNYKIVSAYVFSESDYELTDILAYTTTNINSQIQFDSFYDSITSNSLIDTNTTAEYGDKFLTLLTCDPTDLTTRIIVIAKQI